MKLILFERLNVENVEMNASIASLIEREDLVSYIEELNGKVICKSQA